MHELWGMLRCEDRWIFVKKICCQQPRPHSFPCQPDIFCLLFWLWLLIYGTLSHQELHKALMKRPTRLQSPLPVNVWNKWLLQWRQTPRTTVSHLISQLHERLFVLHSLPQSTSFLRGIWLDQDDCTEKQVQPSIQERWRSKPVTGWMTTIGLHHRISLMLQTPSLI